MNEENPLVSIIVRTKDRPKLLKNALRSISAQAYRPMEVVLVNDGGCDLDIEEIKNILGDVSLNYIRLEKNTGRAHAGNVGIENAKGEYTGFLDDDDEFYPEHVVTLVSFLKQSDYKVAYTDTEMVFQDFTFEEKSPEDIGKRIFSKDFSYSDLLVVNYIPFNSIIFSKSVLTSAGGLDETFELYEDWDLLIRIGQRYPFYHIKKITAKYNQWSRELQINQAGEDRIRALQLFVINRHREKITPKMILNIHNEKERLSIELKNLTDRYEMALNEDNNRILQLEKIVRERDSQILQRDSQTLQRDSQILQRDEAIRERDRRILQLSDTVNLMRETLGWKALEKFRKFREKTFPQGTMRRRFYALAIKSGRVINEEGFKSFFVKVRRRLRFPKPSRILRAGATLYLEEEFTRKPVDIILPIHNGYDYLSQCIDSVFRNTDLDFHSLTLIEDKSTDDRIRDYLKQIDTAGKNIAIIYNDQNMGFVKTVNKGMRLTKKDVILLNSDTIVTKGWIEKMQRAAYSRPNIATVTPFSNNATHCSIPEFLKENTVPKGYTIDSFAQFIEDISLRYYPEILTSVGFCMYIKRDANDKIGHFDELNFDKGYGEECEFCARASRSGFIHVLDDSTYIYHKGAVSFTPVKRSEIVDKHLAIIDKMYPEFLWKVNKFYAENPLRLIHNYIRFRMNIP